MSSPKGMVLQDRDRHLLGELGTMRVLDREQAKIVAGFGSTTRANARLLALTRARLLTRFFMGTTAGGAKALYTLSENGARIVNVPHRGFRRKKDQALVADFFVEHQLAVNEIYCGLKYQIPPTVNTRFRQWKAFQEPLHPGLRLIPDGYIEFETADETVAAFLEVDLGHERLKVWKQKVENYLQLALSGKFTTQFGLRRFRTLVVAHSAVRALSIRSLVASLTDKIFWFASLEAIRQQGPFGAIWLRPRDSAQRHLFQQTP